MKFGPSVNLTTALEAVQNHASPAWTPASLSNVTTYLDASIGTDTTTDTNPVSSWQPQAPGLTTNSGTGLYQRSGGQRPTYTASGINGLPSLTFTATNNQRMASDYLVDNITSWSAFTVFVVCQSTQPALGSMLFGTGSNNNWNVKDVGASNAFSGCYFDGSARTDQSATPASPTNPILITWRLKSGTEYIQINNETETSSAMSNIDSGITGNSLLIGDGPVGTFDGKISLILSCNAALSAGDITSMQNYCKTRWNLW